MATAIQLSLAPELRRRERHGGDLGKGKRKERRPIAAKRPMHVTMHTRYRLAKHRNVIVDLIKEESRKSKVRVYEESINSNHLHLATLSATRRGFQRFLCVIAGKIAQRVTGTGKGQPLQESFWDSPAFTRIVEWGRAFRYLLEYVKMNQKEALGLIPYTPRGKSKNTS